MGTVASLTRRDRNNNFLGRPEFEQKKAVSRRIEGLVRKKQLEEIHHHKLLILGAGDSGKSTLFRQWKNVFGRGWQLKERMAYKKVIIRNTIESMEILCSAQETLNISISDAAESAKEILRKNSSELILNNQVAEAIATLWQDQAMKKAFEERAKFQIIDSAGYMFDRVLSFASSDYIPSEEDCLLCRSRTTGIIQQSFEIDGNVLTVIDVGGQRAERKKWIHCFEGVTAMLFLTAISEYDQFLFEDESVKRLDESLQLFERTSNLDWFENTNIILLFNKMDLFKEKIKKVPFSLHCQDYQGDDDDVEQILHYMRTKFVSSCRNKKKSIFVHFTCATDTKNIEKVLHDVKKIVITESMEAAGFL